MSKVKAYLKVNIIGSVDLPSVTDPTSYAHVLLSKTNKIIGNDYIIFAGEDEMYKIPGKLKVQIKKTNWLTDEELTKQIADCLVTAYTSNADGLTYVELDIILDLIKEVL